MKDLTAETVKATIEAMRAIMGKPEPFAHFMAQEGCPHTEGWRLCLPMKHKTNLPNQELYPWPKYVVFSEQIDKPVFLKQGVIEESSQFRRRS